MASVDVNPESHRVSFPGTMGADGILQRFGEVNYPVDGPGGSLPVYNTPVTHQGAFKPDSETNGPATTALELKSESESWAKINWQPGDPVMIRRSEIYDASRNSYINPNWNGIVSEGHSLSSFNWFLKSDKGKRLYSKRNAEVILRDWTSLGCFAPGMYPPPNNVCTISPTRYIRTKAFDTQCRPGSQIFLILRKVPRMDVISEASVRNSLAYKHKSVSFDPKLDRVLIEDGSLDKIPTSLKDRLNSYRARCTSDPGYRERHKATRAARRKSPYNQRMNKYYASFIVDTDAKKSSDTTETDGHLDRDSKDDDEDPDDLVWQLVPWVGERGTAPPVTSYITPKWIGATFFLGTLMETLTGDYGSTGLQYRIDEYYSPRDETDRYRKVGERIPEIHVQLRVRT